MFVWVLIAAVFVGHRLTAAQQPWVAPNAQQLEANLLRLGWKLKPHTAEQTQFNQMQEQQLQQLFKPSYFVQPQQISVQLQQQQQQQQNLIYQPQPYQLQQPQQQQILQPLSLTAPQLQLQPISNNVPLSSVPQQQQQPQPTMYLQPVMHGTVQQSMDPIPISVKSQPRQPNIIPSPVTTPTLSSPTPVITSLPVQNPPEASLLSSPSSPSPILLPLLPSYHEPLQLPGISQQLLPVPVQPVSAQPQLLPLSQPVIAANNPTTTAKLNSLPKTTAQFILRSKRQTFPPQPAPYQPRVEDYNLPPFYQVSPVD
uniref:Transcription factor SPT20 homolog n=1 Tax=Syphacia muris TaxID=451379 RepID=A0A0N5AED6_9BILA